jgi:hypothetical protein
VKFRKGALPERYQAALQDVRWQPTARTDEGPGSWGNVALVI